jgi:hypothetical protein
MTDGGRLSLPPSFVLEKHEAAKPRERKESIPCDETANSLSPPLQEPASLNSGGLGHALAF